MPVPKFLQDAKTVLTHSGFALRGAWYHGTSSALVDSILKDGLKRSGDEALKQAAKQTMATIGNHYTESIEPVFLTQSKELAYYWAEQTMRNRLLRFDGEEQPVVLAVNMPEELAVGVKPDVGAASLLITKEGESFMAFIAGLYEAAGLVVPKIELTKAGRMDYLNLLGMAYYNKDITVDFIEVLEAQAEE